MNFINPSSARARSTVAVGLAAVMVSALSMPLRSQDTKPGATTSGPGVTAGQTVTNSTAKPSSKIKKEKPAAAKLSGAALYSMHCNRCHPERYPNERTSAQWKTIVLHMRVRANLPADQAKTILTYMQENSGY